MDWNVALFAVKWVVIALFYAALGVLLLGVYRESSRHVKEPRQAAPARSLGRLRLVNPGSEETLLPGTYFPLKLETTLGTDPDSDIVLNDRFISRRHARLQWDGETWWLEDLGSKNGTWLNGQPCPPNRAQVVPAQASITLGDVVFELVD
jgi:hypothetical protein